MIALGVLVSGGGTNLQAILDAIDAGTLAARVAIVISNKPDAGALARAKAHGVPSVVIDHRAYSSRESFDAALVAELTARGVSYVVLAGFMRIVTRTFLDAFPMRVVNVHPSLLPSFPGTSAQKDALLHGVKVTGCTVHFVDPGTDTGPIIAQAAVPVLEGDDAPALAARILEKEHVLLPTVLQWLADGRVEVIPRTSGQGGGRCRVKGVPKTVLGVE
jgi:phosphoribosylglycinamide formyltransferase-1